MNKMHIPLAKPSFNEREVEAIRRVLDSGWVIQGPEVEAFEKAVAKIQQARHCIAVSSGTAALHICYLALGIGSKDAVFIPSFAWPSAANMAMNVGACPVFVDVLDDTYNIDPVDLRFRIEQWIKERWASPRAVVPVHEFGLAADMNAILKIAEEFNMEVVEDAGCALGAAYRGKPVGTFGKLGIFSFHPRKAVTTGEGGVIITNDDLLAEKCRMWRNHGQVVLEGKRQFQIPGMNYRMTEIQAAIGKVQLEKFPGILKRRKEIAQHYFDSLGEHPKIGLPVNNPEHTWQTFMVVLDEEKDRSFVINKLAKNGIGAGAGSVAAHCIHVYRERFGYNVQDLPISTKLDSQGLALPLYSDMTDVEVATVGRKLIAVLSED
jgi:dTDP-4-amino-4,6-dideoxygalactose transaminase